MPSFVIQNLSPYEKLYGIPPSYEHLKSFRCLCFATSPKLGRDKFQSRAIPFIFLGYPYGKKGYKLLSISNHSIFFSRDVVFHEHVFSYRSDSSPILFPLPTPDSVDVLPTPVSHTHRSALSPSTYSSPPHSSPTPSSSSSHPSPVSLPAPSSSPSSFLFAPSPTPPSIPL